MVRVGLVVRVSLVVGVDWGRVGGRDCLDGNIMGRLVGVG